MTIYFISKVVCWIICRSSIAGDSKIWGLTGDAGKDSLTDSKIWGLTGDAGKDRTRTVSKIPKYGDSPGMQARTVSQIPKYGDSPGMQASYCLTDSKIWGLTGDAGKLQSHKTFIIIMLCVLIKAFIFTNPRIF